MYYLRRRHGRKPQSAERREQPLGVASTIDDRKPDQPPPRRTVVITKPKRVRVALPEDEDCMPAGTFRAGTLHVPQAAEGAPNHGKL